MTEPARNGTALDIRMYNGSSFNANLAQGFLHLAEADIDAISGSASRLRFLGILSKANSRDRREN